MQATVGHKQRTSKVIKVDRDDFRLRFGHDISYDDTCFFSCLSALNRRLFWSDIVQRPSSFVKCFFCIHLSGCGSNCWIHHADVFWISLSDIPSKGRSKRDLSMLQAFLRYELFHLTTTLACWWVVWSGQNMDTIALNNSNQQQQQPYNM